MDVKIERGQSIDDVVDEFLGSKTPEERVQLKRNLHNGIAYYESTHCLPTVCAICGRTMQAQSHISEGACNPYDETPGPTGYEATRACKWIAQDLRDYYDDQGNRRE